jgi:phage shock protein PspC (stress-responsive transcriptional regulator)
LGIGLTVRAWRSGRRRDWVVAGVTWGLASYTYLAVRLTPLVFILFVVFLLIFRRIEAGPFLPQRLSNGAVWATVGFALAIAPLAIYTLGNWDVVMGRPAGVSLLEPGINQGDLPGALLSNILKAVGMFVWQGDRIPRHNVPWRPVFDPPMAAAFIAGLVLVVRQARRRIAAVFVLLWVGVMLLPTILSEDVPHFLRAVGVLPVAMIVPALGLDWVAEQLSRWSRVVAVGVLVGAIGLSGWLTLRDYVPYATSVETGYAFESGAVELANEVNRLSTSGHRVLLDDVYVREWMAIPFMLRRAPDVVLNTATALPTQPDAPAVLIAWPYADWVSRLTAWPQPVQVQVQAGPMVKGDRDSQPYAMAVLVRIGPRTGLGDVAEARFEGGLQLLGHTIEDLGELWLLRTLWQIDRPVMSDMTIFTHLLNAGQVAATVDGDAGNGLYPVRMWRVGDVIVDERRVQLPASVNRSQLSLEMGLYDRAGGARVKLIDSGSPVSDDALQLGAPGGPGP